MTKPKKLVGRDARLQLDRDSLTKLSKRSRLIEIKPIEVVPGRLPEKYLVTFRVNSIIGIKENNEPIFDNFHQVEIYLHQQYPGREPLLKWKTPIWHPNIEHLEPKNVCINAFISWNSSKELDDLVIELGEMAQYKLYHAIWEDPFPKDAEVAKWVRNYAEPNGIIGPGKPTDNRRLLKEYDILSPPNEKKQAKKKNKFFQSGFEIGNEIVGNIVGLSDAQLYSDGVDNQDSKPNKSSKSKNQKGFELGELMK